MPINRNPAQHDRRSRMYQGLWDQLIEELEACRGIDGKGLPAELLDRLRQEIPKDVDASDIYKAEVAAFPYLSDHELKLRLVSLRDMISNLTTAETYARLQSVFNPNLDDREANLAEAYALASRLHRRYVLVPSIEELRTSIAIKLLGSAGIAICLAIALAIGGIVQIQLGYGVAIASGICGAVVSTIMRLYKFDSRHEPMLTWYNLEQGQLSLYVTPFLGGVFATVLLLLMHGGLVQGDLFPKFNSPHEDGVHACWRNLHPLFDKGCNTYLELSKIIVWCFLSGWSERLVPDVLDKLTAYSVETRGPAQVRG